MWIDVNEVYAPSLLAEEYEAVNYLSCLSDLPEYMTIHGSSYVLCGAIEFITPTFENGTGHYVAYVRRINNVWEKRNSMCNKAEILGKKN